MTRRNGIQPFAVDPDGAPTARTGLPVVVIGAGPVGLVITMSRYPTGPTLPHASASQRHWQLDFPGDDLAAMRTFCAGVDQRLQALLHPPSR